nr:hypothetical protein StreXyl84_62130 [Streptomyces sp. Xyl84]
MRWSQTAAETWAGLRRHPHPNLPVGTVGFAGSRPYADQRGHGHEIGRVSYDGGEVRSVNVCGRPAGSEVPLTAPPGPQGADPHTVCRPALTLGRLGGSRVVRWRRDGAVGRAAALLPAAAAPPGVTDLCACTRAATGPGRGPPRAPGSPAGQV